MLHTFAAYLRMAVPFVYLLGSWRFGDWANWKKYYPTVLYMVSVDFFVALLMYDYPLWSFQGALLIPNHTVADFIITFSVFTQIAFIYLSKYPYSSRWYKQGIYVAFWVVSEVMFEYLFMSVKLITYEHGWNFGWSILVWIFMFIGLRLHHTKPLLAWLLCFAGCRIFNSLLSHSDYEVQMMKSDFLGNSSCRMVIIAVTMTELYQEKMTLVEHQIEYYFQNELFAWQWWFLAALTVLPWVLWFVIRDRPRQG